MKKILAGISALVLSVGLVGCGADETDVATKQEVSETVMLDVDEEKGTEEITEEEIEETEESIVETEITEKAVIDENLTVAQIINKALFNLGAIDNERGYDCSVDMKMHIETSVPEEYLNEMDDMPEGILTQDMSAVMSMQVQNGVCYLTENMQLEGEEEIVVESYITANTGTNQDIYPTIIYVKDDVMDTWYSEKSTQDLGNMLVNNVFSIGGNSASAPISSLTEDETFMEYAELDTSTENYVITLDYAKIMSDLLADMDEGSNDLGEIAALSILKNCKGTIIYTISSSFELLDMSIDGLSFDMSIFGIDMNMVMDMSFNVKPLEEGVKIVIPEEVLTNSKDIIHSYSDEDIDWGWNVDDYVV